MINLIMPSLAFCLLKKDVFCKDRLAVLCIKSTNVWERFQTNNKDTDVMMKLRKSGNICVAMFCFGFRNLTLKFTTS